MSSILSIKPVPAVPAVPADQDLPTPGTPRLLYALSLFAWIKGHPDASSDDFVEMLERAEERTAKLRGEPR
jgi:hypothetical protein